MQEGGEWLPQGADGNKASQCVLGSWGTGTGEGVAQGAGWGSGVVARGLSIDREAKRITGNNKM